jgi:hypothetical protein
MEMQEAVRMDDGVALPLLKTLGREAGMRMVRN